MTAEKLRQLLVKFDKGVLMHGSHRAGSSEFCGLEFDSVVRGRPFSDEPTTLPDFRPLNDGPWSSDEARTSGILPVMVALWDWENRVPAWRQAWLERVVIETIRQIIAELPDLPASIRDRCRAVRVVEGAEAAGVAAAAAKAAGVAEARRAARAARAAAAAEAAEAAAAAAEARTATAEAAAEAEAAAAAAEAARAAGVAEAADQVLRCACQIWIDAAKELE